MGGKRRTQTAAQRGVLVAAVAGWIAVVVIAAGERSEETALLGVENLSVVYIVAMSLVALAGLVVLIVLWPRDRVKDAAPPGKKRAVWLWAVLALMLIVWRPELVQDVTEAVNIPVPEPLGDVPVDGTAERGPKPVAQVTDVLLLLSLAALCAGAWLWTRRSADALAADGEEGLRFEADLALAMETATAELLADGDPRSAVMNAYATLETVLAERGTRRARPETATEHISRALSGLSIDPAPVVRLGELYEIARFSDRAITVTDQRAAARSLDEARSQLQASSRPAAS